MANSIESVFGGKYEILKEIGRGGMSIVYLAMDRHLNKQWAIKEIKKSGTSQKGVVYVQSLITEANLMKKLDHPAIPRIVDIIENDAAIYVVMDYVEGESLDKAACGCAELSAHAKPADHLPGYEAGERDAQAGRHGQADRLWHGT